MTQSSVVVESPNLNYNDNYIEANYTYQTTRAERIGSKVVVQPLDIPVQIRTNRDVPRLGVMLVGWGGNNGSTFTAGLIANQLNLTWNNKTGKHSPNWYGSLTQCSTVNLGCNSQRELINVPLSSLLPMVEPNDVLVDGWDISSFNLTEAMRRSKVIDYDLQQQLAGVMSEMAPRPSIYYPDFIAANQNERANNVIAGSKWDHLQQIQADIRDFKEKKALDKVIVLWTANTERFTDIVPNVNDTAEALLESIKTGSPFIAPSTIFAVASILEGCTYINGSPQNTFVPGVVDLAQSKGVFIGGDDFKTGQTKLKSVLVDFLVSAGIKPLSIVSYNHLGNNDGFNLSSPQQFKSKEVTKSNVIEDMVRSNAVLYKETETPNHCVVIKYIPAVGDSKRALDEYTSELMLDGRNTLVINNTCEDSLLAAPIILDLILLAELVQRIQIKEAGESSYTSLYSSLSILSYLCKAPLVPHNTPIVNSLFRQRACIENILRACLSLPPENNMLLEYKFKTVLSENWKNGK